ncbi:MAG: T9SS type A sorting domain-containing protein [Bacteroidota bacterium]|nr:T9SS type A sorting domain-containing protein [Bacteroidota bacterium]
MKLIIHILLLFITSHLYGQNMHSDLYSLSNSYPDSIYNPYSIAVLKNLKSPDIRLDSIYYYTYDVIQTDWGENQSTLFSYNEQNFISLKIIRSWNSISENWINQTSDERFYDDNGLLTHKLVSSWSQQSGIWLPASKREYTYKPSLLLDHYLAFSWNETSQNWDTVSKYSYDFDLLGNWTHYLRQYWNTDSSRFINDYQFIYEFEDNRKIHFLRQKWDPDNNTWVNGNQSFYDYDSSRLFVSELQEIWDTNLSDWNFFTLISFKYNGANQVIEKKYQSWTGTEWINFVLYDYSYNEILQNTMIRYFIWNSSYSGWDVHNRYIYEFGEYGELSLEEGHSWNSTSALWEYLYRLEYYYSQSAFPLSVSISDSSNISCYGYNDGWAIASASGGTPPYSYSWDDDAMTIGNDVDSLEAGRYYLVIVTDNDLNTAKDSIILTEPPLVDPGHIFGDSLVEYGSRHEYYVQAHVGSSYYWEVTGGKIHSGQGTSRIKVTWKIYGTGSISLVETDSSNCYSNPVVLNVHIGQVGIPAQYNSDEVLVFPNPFRDEIFIKITPLHSPSFNAEILNITGTVIKKLHFKGSVVQLSTLDLPPGIYFLKLSCEDFYHLQKIVKVH